MTFWLQKGQALDISVAQKVKRLLSDYKCLDTGNSKRTAKVRIQDLQGGNAAGLLSTKRNSPL